MANHLAPQAGIFDLVMCGTCQRITGHIADAISGRLDGMHVNRGKIVKNVRRLMKLDPVKLDILAGGEMAKTKVELAGNGSKTTHLGRGQHTICNGDADHVGVKLQI